jgi:hypothetical protein
MWGGVAGGGDGGAWAVASAVAVVVVLGWLLSRRGAQGNLPPGSLGWPILGETLTFLGHASRNNWTQFYKDHVAKYGQVPNPHPPIQFPICVDFAFLAGPNWYAPVIEVEELGVWMGPLPGVQDQHLPEHHGDHAGPRGGQVLVLEREQNRGCRRTVVTPFRSHAPWP